MGNKLSAYLAGASATAIFGLSFLFTKNALDYVEPIHFIALRFALAALLMSALIILRVLHVSYKGKNLRPLFLVALFQPVIYFICEVFGIQLTSSSQAGMMIALIPIVVAILSAIFLKERTTPTQVAFIVLSVSGVFLILLMQQSGFALSGSSIGYLLLMGAVVSAGLFNILSRLSSRHFKPIEITYMMMWVGAITFNAVAIVMHKGSAVAYLAPLENPTVLGSLIYLSCFSSILAFLLINYSLSRLEATKSAVLSNLATIVSIIAGVVFRNEPFFWYHALGTTMILLGVWGTSYFGRRNGAEIENS